MVSFELPINPKGDEGTHHGPSQKIREKALVGFQGLILKCASETLNLFIRPLKNNHLKGDAGRKNRVVRHCYIHDPGIQQEPLVVSTAYTDIPARCRLTSPHG